MRISVNLLRTLVEFDWPLDRLIEKLTMSGSEVELVETKGDDIKGIVAARVTRVNTQSYWVSSTAMTRASSTSIGRMLKTM